MSWGYDTTALRNGMKEFREGYDGIKWGDDGVYEVDASVPPVEDCIAEILHLQKCVSCEGGE